MKDLKVGDKIIAIDPHEIGDGGQQVLTVGKEYTISSDYDGGFYIKNDKGYYHGFSFDAFSKYFKLPETEIPGKLYPFAEEVDMLVWDTDESKVLKRTVFGRRDGKFLTWNSYDNNLIPRGKTPNRYPKQ